LIVDADQLWLEDIVAIGDQARHILERECLLACEVRVLHQQLVDHDLILSTDTLRVSLRHLLLHTFP
jgi:hypothetical protein